MLTGDVVPTSGTAHLLGLEITQEQRRARQLIGYCPQFDACQLPAVCDIAAERRE